MEHIAFDVHKQYSLACLFDDQTGEVKHQRRDNSRRQFEEFFANCQSPRVVLEAGRSSYMVYDLIEDLVSDIQMANPLQVKAIAWAVVKTDKVDAETLCKLLRADVVPTTYVRSRQNRELLNCLRQRLFYVKMRTMLKNRIHALVDRQGEDIRRRRPVASDLFGKAGREWLGRRPLACATEKMLLDEMLALSDFFGELIKASNRLVYRLCKEDPIANRLRTIPGIGRFLALLIRAEIGELERFRDEKKLHAYAGLVPGVSSSGGKTHMRGVPKACNQWLKWALVEAVQPAVRKNFWLKARYQELAARKPSAVAIVATARLLLTLVYKVWKEDRPFVLGIPSRGNSNGHRVVLSHS